MGWNASHLHRFSKGRRLWGVPELDDGPDLIDEGRMQLAKVLTAEGDSMVYFYDFGDNWRHEIVLEKFLPAEGNRPICLVGERRCPPEDVGGVHGYRVFLDIIFDPTHKEYEDMIRWAGGHFVDEFDGRAVNEKLSSIPWPVRHGRSHASA